MRDGQKRGVVILSRNPSARSWDGDTGLPPEYGRGTVYDNPWRVLEAVLAGEVTVVAVDLSAGGGFRPVVLRLLGEMDTGLQLIAFGYEDNGPHDPVLVPGARWVRAGSGVRLVRPQGGRPESGRGDAGGYSADMPWEIVGEAGRMMLKAEGDKGAARMLGSWLVERGGVGWVVTRLRGAGADVSVVQQGREVPETAPAELDVLLSDGVWEADIEISAAHVVLPWVAGGVLEGATVMERPPVAASLSSGLLITAAGRLAAALARLRRLRRESRTDELTALGNRRFLKEQLTREILLAKRYGTPLTVVMIDLDDFKRVNDEFGHTAGDMVLRRTASAMVSVARGSDIVARYGGDEFVVVLPRTDLKGARRFVSRLHEALGALKIGLPVEMCFSAGAAEYSKENSDAEKLIGAADAALAAGRRGRRAQGG